METTVGGFMFTDADELHQRAERARRRLDEATVGSPDWDAAMAQLDEVEAWLAERASSPELLELAG